MGTTPAPAMDSRKRRRPATLADKLRLARMMVMYASLGRNLTKFTALLDNWKWRNKVFKNVQYTGKLVLWGMERRGADKTHPEFHGRLKTTTKVLSLVRRFQIALSWMEDWVDVQEAWADGDWLGVAIYATSFVTDLSDDVLTLAKAKILDKKSLHPAIERSGEIFWGVSTVLQIVKNVGKYRKAAAAEEAARAALPRPHAALAQGTGERTSSSLSLSGDEAVADDAGAAARAAAAAAKARAAHSKAALKRRLAIVNLIKYCCDAGQSLPGAVAWEEYPDIADHLSGWMSGLLSTYKIWIS